MDQPGIPKHELDTPALCIDLPTLQANIRRMAEMTQAMGVSLRPHIKTHKCPAIARMQLDAGAVGVTCAKVSEAEVMAAAGIRDILIANQIVARQKVARLMGLAAYTDVMVAVDDAANVADLGAAARAHGVTLRALVEVDIGMGRCGIAPGAPAVELARQVAGTEGLRFEGVMGYEGHAVMIPDADERRRVTQASLTLLTDTVAQVRAAGLPVNIVSSGGTPTFAITGAWPGVTELQPGAYATMDAQYRHHVGMTEFGCALTLVSTVVSVRDDRAVIDAGLKSMTRDFGPPLVIDPPGWEIVGLSEEHGRLARRDGAPLRPGDRVEIAPNHGCTTINLHDRFHVIRDGCVVAVWPVAARGKVA